MAEEVDGGDGGVGGLIEMANDMGTRLMMMMAMSNMEFNFMHKISRVFCARLKEWK